MVDHKVKPSEADLDNPTLENETITEDQFRTFLDALGDGAKYRTACRDAGLSKHGMQEYVKRTEARGVRVARARASWELFHLRRLKKDNDDGSGSSSRVRASLGALASVDKRYRKEVHVGGTQIHNTLILADPRPAGLIGNPERYALANQPVPEQQQPAPMIQADATVIDTPPVENAPVVPEPEPPTSAKPGPIL